MAIFHKEARSVTFAFLGNYQYDSRLFNFSNSFKNKGYSVSIISFDWLTEGFTTISGEKSVFKLHKSGFSILFYLRFAAILLYKLFGSKGSLFFAEDIYTLPFVLFVAKIKGVPVVYDSREVFSELAGLRNKPNLQKAISWIEKKCIHRVDLIFTTGEMDSAHIEKLYGLKPTLLMRNLPPRQLSIKPFPLRSRLNIEKSKQILLYQGAVLHGRGLGLILPCLKSLPNVALVVVGGGEQLAFYRNMAHEFGVSDQVYFFGKVTQEELLPITAAADIGLSIIENLSLSYYYALPNKMFEYIQAGVPVFVSDFPQMKAIVDEYGVGVYVNPEDPSELLRRLMEFVTVSEVRDTCKKNCMVAASTLNWDNEFEKVYPNLQKLLMEN